MSIFKAQRPRPPAAGRSQTVVKVIGLSRVAVLERRVRRLVLHLHFSLGRERNGVNQLLFGTVAPVMIVSISSEPAVNIVLIPCPADIDTTKSHAAALPLRVSLALQFLRKAFVSFL